MEAEDSETLDLMNVESFSQLPFVRSSSAAAKEKASVRLFGIDFDGSEVEQSGENAAGSKEAQPAKPGEPNRRFECHYCCRNFPTSQALGGHQNAHKRERQHAKRAHLQSAATVIHHVNMPPPEFHSYGLVNYKIGSYLPPPSTSSFLTPSSTSYPGSFYGNHHHPPISGGQMGFYRLPGNGSNSGEVERTIRDGVTTLSGETTTRVKEKSATKENVSLDLRL